MHERLSNRSSSELDDEMFEHTLRRPRGRGIHVSRRLLSLVWFLRHLCQQQSGSLAHIRPQGFHLKACLGSSCSRREGMWRYLWACGLWSEEEGDAMWLGQAPRKELGSYNSSAWPECCFDCPHSKQMACEIDPCYFGCVQCLPPSIPQVSVPSRQCRDEECDARCSRKSADASGSCLDGRCHCRHA